jgi:hypothetical protein
MGFKSRHLTAAAIFIAGIGYVLTCQMTFNTGSFVAIRHYYPILFVAGGLVVLGPTLLAQCRESVAFLVSDWRYIAVFAALFCLIGAPHLISHGDSFASLSVNYWDMSDPSNLARRITVPVLAHLLWLDGPLYLYFWYALFIVTWIVAIKFLSDLDLSALEILSISTSSIVAYLLIVPGYNEVIVFLFGMIACRQRLSDPLKFILLSLMVGAHEIATVFVLAAIVLQAKSVTERRSWIILGGICFAAYAIGYALNWDLTLDAAFNTAYRPSPGSTETSFDWLTGHPWRAIAGIGVAYKLYWLVVVLALSGWFGRRNSLTAAVTLAALPLILIATDVSRMVQFTSLSLFLLAPLILRQARPPTRAGLALANLACPSFYISSNWVPMTGNGLYSLYALISF